MTIAIGQEDVPVGSYTRTVLDKLPAAPVRATDGRLEAVNLPGDLQARVAYGVAVVKGAKQPEQAQAFIDGLLDGAGAHALKDARFEPPPGQ